MTEELEKKVQSAIKLIQSASKIAAKNNCPEIEVSYSGGKDSDVILELTRMAGIPYRAIYKNTTIDPIGTVKHCKDKGVEIIRPNKTFFQLVRERGLPSRFARFCCEELKEYKILDYAILGVRKEESVKRSNLYKEPELCRDYKTGESARQYFPILDWRQEDISDFVELRSIQAHPLYYDENGKFHPERRLGCIGCPLVSRRKRIEDFLANKKFLRLYAINAQIWYDKKPRKSFTSGYDALCFQLFCNNRFEFDEKFGENLFGGRTDCKDFLETFFNVKI